MLCVQLKWNLPDETGGEVITQYHLKVKPLPVGFTGGVPDEEVRRTGWQRCLDISSVRVVIALLTLPRRTVLNSTTAMYNRMCSHPQRMSAA